MAVVHPSSYPKKQEPNDPEFEVYQTLLKLPDTWHVYYSVRLKGMRRENDDCEVDFILFDGSRRMLCLEVKGGQLEYRGDERRWYQNDRRLDKSPDEQAMTGMHALKEYLGPLAACINFGWAVCFPNCAMLQHNALPSSLRSEILVDQRTLLDVEKAVDAASGYYVKQFNKAGCDAATAKAIHEKLSRGIGFVTDTGIRIARDYQQLIQVTEEQFQVLDDLEVNARIVVRGFAGTGKTLLAQTFAARLAARGQQVLLLFYNRAVANEVRYAFDRDAPITCGTFHSLARQWIEAADAGWWDAHVKEGTPAFWEEEVPCKLLEALAGKPPMFDAIIVDEGQDFKKDWFTILEELLKDKEAGHFAVFYDEQQDIFGHWTDLPWGSDHVTRKVLTKTCRNTRSIIDYISAHSGCELHPFEHSPNGLEVVERHVPTKEKELAAFTEDAKKLLKDGVKPEQMIVLLNQPKDDSCLAGITKIGRHTLESMGRSMHPRATSIRYTTISVFKGLEADVIFVLGCHGMNEEQLRSAIYVQGSRARTVLYIYIPKV